MRFENVARAFLTVSLLGLAFGKGAFAQIDLTNAGAPYTQNFDSLSATATTTPYAVFTNNSSTNGLLGLYARQFGGTDPAGAPTAYRSDNGGSATGALYSYGTTNSSERALGSLPNSTPGAFEYGFRFKNNGTTAITGFTLTYTGEQWRDAATSSQKLMFSYAVFSSGTTGDIGNEALASPTGYVRDSRYTAVTALDFTSPSNNSSAGIAVNGNAAANRVAGITGSASGLTIAAGDELWVRWVDINDAGTDHGLAIDDLSLTATFVTPTDTPEPTSLVLLGGAGLPLGALWMRSRKRK